MKVLYSAVNRPLALAVIFILSEDSIFAKEAYSCDLQLILAKKLAKLIAL